MTVNIEFPEQPKPQVSPTSFTSNVPQVVSGSTDLPIFPSIQTHLTTDELKRDGTSWVKVLLITAILLFLLDAGVYGYNFWRGVENPDLLAPINVLLNR